MRPLTTLDRRALLKALSLAPSHAVRVPPAVEAELREAGLISSQVCLLSGVADAAGQAPAAALLRAELAEDLPGLPLELRLQVVSDSGTPLAGTRVDVWHQGPVHERTGQDLSGRELSGRQVADASGCLQFRTVFPEAGPGGPAVIHLRLHLMTGEVAETTLAFDPALRRKNHQSHVGDATLAMQVAALGAGTYTPVTPRMTAPNGQMAVALVVGITRGGTEIGLNDRILHRA